MGKEILLKLVLFGGLLLAAAACTNGLEGIFARTESGGVVTYALRTELLVLAVACVLTMVMVGERWRRNKEDFGILLLALGAFFGLVLIPIMAYQQVRIAEDYFEDRYFYWWLPGVDRYEFADLAQLRVESSTSTTKGMKVRSYRLLLTDHDGEVHEVTMGDSKARATLDVARAAREAGVPVSGLSSQLRRDAGEEPPSRRQLSLEQDPSEMIYEWNRREATLRRVEALQEEFGLADEAFEELLQTDWQERHPDQRTVPWQFRFGGTEPTFWRTLQEWDYDAVRARVEKAAAAEPEAEPPAEDDDETDDFDDALPPEESQPAE